MTHKRIARRKELFFMSDAKTLAFIGAHPHKLPFGLDSDRKDAEPLKAAVRGKLVRLIEEENVRHFVSGAAMGPDHICAEIVLDLKRQYPDITLEAVTHKGQAFLWPQKYRDAYRRILERCDGIHAVAGDCADETDGRAEKQARYMTNRCDILLAILDGEGKGPEDMLEYARQCGKEVMAVRPDGQWES
jgi:uncharacterized phage-like protein YoqJ